MLLERFDLTSTNSLPIAFQIYFDLLRSQFSPTAISSPFRADSIPNSQHLLIYITTLTSRCIPHRLDEMDDDRNFHNPSDKANAGEMSMNIQPPDARLAGLKKEFRRASTIFFGADASCVNPYEVSMSLITSDRSLNSLSEHIPKVFPLRYNRGPNRSQQPH